MPWFLLGLFVVSFVLVALLQPKPEIENAKAQEFDANAFPQATENSPIPLVLGKVRQNGPNTIWYGLFGTRRISQRVKTGLFSSKRVTTGYKYDLSLNMALGLGPNISLHEIYIDEERVWEGDTAGAETTVISIDRADLFGGHKNGGGWVSTGIFYNGSFTQPVSLFSQVATGLGANMPAYRGTSHITFDNAYIGESPQLRKIAFVISQYTNDLLLPNSGRIGDDDINPVEALYQIMVDSWFGLGISPDAIDLTSFLTHGTTLAAEGNGVSLLISSPSDARRAFAEILRQIDGLLYHDPDSGKITLTLVRNDYDVDDLPLYDEDDIIKIKSFTRSSWDDVRGQVKVTYKNREKESDSVAVAQDSGVIQQTRKVRTDGLTMPFLYDPGTATSIASRELSQISVPLFRAEIEFNRGAAALRPGSVFALAWDEYGFERIVMRVQKFDFGALADGRLVATCLQDNFAIAATLFAQPEPTSWLAPVTRPQDITEFQLVEMPYFYANRLENPLPDGIAGAYPLMVRPGPSSTGFDMSSGNFSGYTQEEDEFYDPEDQDYPATGELTAAYPRTSGAQTGLDATGFTIDGVTGTFAAASSLTELRDGEIGVIYVGGEYMGYTGLTDNLDGTFTLHGVYRGLFGTSFIDHAQDARVYQLDVALFGDGNNDEFTDAGTLYYRLLDRFGPTVQEFTDVAESSFTATGVADRPMRPRTVLVDGSRTGVEIAFGSSPTLSWLTTDRSNAELVTIESDAAETPDQAEEYIVEVWLNGTQVASATTVLASSGLTMDFDSTDLGNVSPTSDGELRVYSRRTGGDLRQSTGYASLTFEWTLDKMLLEGDAQSGNDGLLLEGDQQDGTDVLTLSGDANG